jgi:hypothetical protein
MNTRSAFQPKGATGLNRGLVAYWRLDESSGNASDSFSTNTLTNSNVTYSAQKIGNGAVFNGSSAKLVAGSAVLPLGAKSISFWFQSSATATNMTVLGNGNWDIAENGSSAYIGSGDSKITFQLKNTSAVNVIATSISVCDNVLRLITYTWDGTTSTNSLKVYINGSLDTQATATATEVNSPGGNLTIGATRTRDLYWLNGKIDELGVWNRALTSDEVTELYNSTNGKQLPSQSLSTKAYYPLNGNSTDYSGNANHGTDTAITYPQGRFGQGVKQNGSTSIISVNSIAQYFNGTTWTFSCWEKNYTYGTYSQPFSVGNAATWTTGTQELAIRQFSATQKVVAYAKNPPTGSVDIPYTVPTKGWFNTVVTYNAGAYSVYVNGRLATTGTKTTETTFNIAALGGTPISGIGYRGYPDTDMFDEVIIESRAWTAKEVETYYRKSVQNYRKGFWANIVPIIISITKATLSITPKATAINQAIKISKAQMTITGKAVNILVRGWRNVIKNTATWTAVNKAVSSWTNRTKN